MPITLTIKQVPEAIADGLRRRAAANHRSQQRELLLILERAVAGEPASSARIAEPAPPAYATKASAAKLGKPTSKIKTGKLSLEQLWQRARKLGASMPDEATAIIRRDRDARHGR